MVPSTREELALVDTLDSLDTLDNLVADTRLVRNDRVSGTKYHNTLQLSIKIYWELTSTVF